MKVILVLILLFTNNVIAKTNGFIAIKNVSHPQDFVKQNKQNSLWFAYQVKAQENTKSMCCWESTNSNNKQCNLEKLNTSFGSSDSDGLTENLNIYVKLEKGKIKNMLSVGDECEVITGNNQVSWLHEIELGSSIKWLKNIIKNEGQEIVHSALFALANHYGQMASSSLFDIALLNNDRSENAVFWLGNSRNDGAIYLKKLYEQLPNGHVKKHINFALSQSNTPESLAMLKNIALVDENIEQRADAYFWLAEKGMPGIEDFLLSAINNDNSYEIKDKAIFGLSQVKSEKANKALFNLVKNNKKSQIREKALFWLSQNSPDKAKVAIFEILKSTQSEQEINNAVFTLSQLAINNSDTLLFDLLKKDYSRSIKKQALFWLSQSENIETIQKLQSILL